MMIAGHASDAERLRQVVQAFQGQIGIDNLAVNTVTWTTVGAAFTDTAIAHGMGRVPSGYIVLQKSALADVYNASTGTTLWDDTNIYLRTNGAAGTVFVLMIV